MLAIHLENSRVAVREIPLPPRPRGFSLIRLIAAGICNTDLELQRGYYGFAGQPGHEFVGEVAESDDPALVGRRVCGEINLGCLQCDWCARGLARHCPNRTVLGIVRHPGAFAEYFTLPDGNLHVLPGSISSEDGVFLEPLAAAARILDQVKLEPGDRAAVLGDGKLGLLIAQVLHASGADPVLFGKHSGKLALASVRGIRTERFAEPVPAGAFTLTVDATGSPAGLRAAIAMTEPLGRVVLKSTMHGAAEWDAVPVIVNEITLTGSRCGRFEPAIELLASRRVSVAEMVSERFPLDQAAAAFERAAAQGVMKVLLTPPR